MLTPEEQAELSALRAKYKPQQEAIPLPEGRPDNWIGEYTGRQRFKPITTEEYQQEIGGADSGNPYARQLAVEEMSRAMPTTAVPAVAIGAMKSASSFLGTINNIASTLADTARIPEEYRPAFLKIAAEELSNRGDYWEQVFNEQGGSGVQKIIGKVVGSFPIAAKEFSLGVPYAAGAGFSDYWANHPEEPVGERLLKALTVGTYEGGKRKLLGWGLGKVGEIESGAVRRTVGGSTFAASDIADKAVKSIATFENQFGSSEDMTADAITQFILGFSLSGQKRETVPLQEIAKQAKARQAEALKAGDAKRAENLGRIAKTAEAQESLEAKGGGLTRGRLSGAPSDKKLEKFIRGSSWGGEKLVQKDIANEIAIEAIGKDIKYKPVPQGKVQPTKVMGEKSVKPMKTLVSKAEKYTASQTEKASEYVERKSIETAKKTSGAIDKIRTNASQKVGENIPKEPLSGKIDPKAKQVIFESKYKPLFEKAKNSGVKVDVEPVLSQAGVSKINPAQVKAYNRAVADQIKSMSKFGKPSPDIVESVKAQLRQQYGITGSIEQMEVAIAENVITTDVANRIVSKMPRGENGIEFETAHTVKSALSRAASKARASGNANAARIIENAKFALDNQMAKTARQIGIEKNWRNIDTAYNQTQLYDEMIDIFKGNVSENPITKEITIKNGNKFAKQLKDNAIDLQRSGLSAGEISNLANMAQNAEVLKGLSGAKVIDKMADFGTKYPQKYAELFPESPLKAIKKIQVRNQKIDAGAKEIGKIAESIKNDPSGAAKNLLTNTGIDGAEQIRKTFKIIGASQKAQMQHRMVEELLKMSGNLRDNVNAIPEANWRAAFGNATIKGDLLRLANIVELSTAKTVGDTPPRMLYALERSPVILAIYGFLRHGDVPALASGAGAEMAVVAGERAVGWWIANPNARKILFKALEAEAPQKSKWLNILNKYTNKDQIEQMNAEDTISSKGLQ